MTGEGAGSHGDPRGFLWVQMPAEKKLGIKKLSFTYESNRLTYRWLFLCALLKVSVSLVQKTRDLQRLRSAHEILNALLGDLDLAVVHELDEADHVLLVDVPEDDDGMLARVALEKERRGCNIG